MTLNSRSNLETTEPSNTLFRAISPYKFNFKPLLAVLSAKPNVDLRPSMKSLGMDIRDQGARGTCSVFALTCLLEYMYGEHLGAQAANLSEEYLNYVSNITINENVDGGFFWALDKGYQAQGILHESKVPYQSAPINSLNHDLLAQGRQWPRLKVDFIKPWDATKGASQAQLDKVLKYLDRYIPVAFGGWWPDSTIAGSTEILGVDVMNVPSPSQKGAGLFDGHSVVLVGYGKNPAFPGGGYFIFRNSWGKTFGDQGYGYMPFEYVLDFANDLLAYHLDGFKGKSLSLQATTTRSNRLDVIGADIFGKVGIASWQPDVAGGRWRSWWHVRDGTTGSGGPVSLVSRTADQLDAFTTGQNGQVYTAAWNKKANNGLWQGWWQISKVPVKAGYAVSAVSRKPDCLDIFIIGTDGKVYTAAWNAKANNGKWQGWWQIGTLSGRPGGWVSVVSRGPEQLDIFTTTTSGTIYGAAWDAKVNGGKWQDWKPINNGIAALGSPVTAVSRHPDQLDLFIIGSDHGVWTAAWNRNENNGKWKGWWKILDVKAKQGSPVAAVARKSDQLDLFVIENNGSICTASWNPNVSGGKWQGWWPIKNGKAAPGSGITAASRGQDNLDVFVVGQDGRVWTAAWAKNVADNKWQGWWPI